MSAWLQKNMATWSPFSVMVLIVAIGFIFVFIFDTIMRIDVPMYVLTMLGVLLGASGGTSLLTQGVSKSSAIATKVATDTAVGVATGTPSNGIPATPTPPTSGPTGGNAA